MTARRSFWTNVTIVAAAVTMVGGIVAAGVGFFGTSRQSEFEQQTELCKLAYAVLTDENLTPTLTPAQTKQFVADQLRLAQKCAQRIV